MRSKRFFAILLALCLVISAFSPAVSAVEIGKNTMTSPEVSVKQNVSSDEKAPNRDNDRVVSGDSAQGLQNLRDDPLLRGEVQENTTGIWQVTPGQNPGISLLPEESPACLEELKKAAEIFSKDENVVAFVVLNDKALADTHGTMSAVSADEKAALLNKQEAVIRAIEKNVLNGEKLTVRYQFTYLTNAFSIETKFENLEKIAMLSGVKSVFIMPVYDACEVENTAAPNTAASGAMTGVANVWADLGYTGEGMKIAIIDTGLDLDHPSFSALDAELVAANDSYLSVDDVAAVMEELHASDRRATAAAKTLYRSTKVPFAFNYCDNNLTADHSADMQGDHGTHVAGIAAANPTEGTSVVGMAPNAQIIVMKVFGAAGGAYTDDYVAALEDAMVLGCDVANLSLGSPAGFSSTDTEIDLIFQRIAEQDIIVTISAGNETDSAYGNMWGTDLNRTQNPDKGVVGGPSTWANAFSIASAENSVVMTEFFTLANGTNVFFMHNYEYLLGYVPWSLMDFAGEELEYVIVPGLGTPEDVAKVKVEGKIAVIKRGELSFGEKVYNAEMAGAAGVIIWNNNDTDDIFSFGMNTQIEEGVYPNIPVALITQADGQKLADAAEKKLTVSAELGQRMVEGGQMSSFSSWGAAPDLRLLPDITGIGGNVYSCYDGGQYGLMSGTSMSAPQIAGISALVMQYLYDTYPEAEEGEIRELAMALMMSTANPVISAGSGVEASPRQQDAGLVDAAEAVKTHAYLTVNGSRPKVELGDGSTGVYTFSFEVNNFGTKTQTYTLDSSLLTESIGSDGYNYYMMGEEMELTGAVTFDKETVTVAPGETVTVNATITLSDMDKALFYYYWENGGYVEGYVYLDNADEYGIDLNLPFMGFYGDWTQAPVFDSAFWYDNSFWGYMPANGLPEGDQYFHTFWTSMGGTDWVLGFNPYAENILDENGNVEYDPAYNVVSPNGDGFLDGIDEIYLSLLRNAKDMTFTWTVGDEVVYVENYHNNMKTMYISAYGQIVPWLYSWYGMGMYDFTDAQGNPLPNGTEVLLTISATVDYADGGNHVLEVPFVVDTQAPVLGDVFEVAVDESSNKLIVTATDNIALGAVALMNPTGTQLYQQVSDFEVTEDGTYIATLDVTGLGTEFLIALCDRAANETYFNVTYTTSKGDNLPIMDTDLLYAYRQYDDAIYSDHMYGWVAFNKPADSADLLPHVVAQTDDYLEYAAINAAEYAGGKVFAVDAVGNLVVMDPGLWNRTTICNLNVNALDMAFDDSTDTMYLLAQDEYDETYLYSVNLLTGELTLVHYFGYFYYAPWAITTDDNGTIYAVGYQKSNIYTLDVENDYEMVPVLMAEVTDEEGNTSVEPAKITDFWGNVISPNYMQSITYVDGVIYWAYFSNSWRGMGSELIAIDLETGTYSNHPFAAQAYDQNNNLVDYYSVYYPMEFVGLLSLDETDYQIPAAEALTGIMLDTTELMLSVGETVTLNASPIPWNYELKDVTWTTSDDTVVTVENGNVVAVGEGMAMVTASSEGFEATCLINVVNVSGNVYAYNYYSGDGYYGYLIDMDLATMDYALLGEMPVDFLAADYNGHDGWYYGYIEGGQFCKMNLATGEFMKLGNPIGSAPADMAYNYAEGIMYAITLNFDYGYTALNQVNLSNGQLIEVARFDYLYFMTLAADLEGNLYGITADGYICQMSNVYDDWFEEYTWMAMPIMYYEVGFLQYMQSMCYDYANDVLIWTNPESACVYWIDVKAEVPYILALGDPTGTGTVEHVGMFTIPETLPELDPMAVEGVYAEDMIMVVGANKSANVTVLPLNATSKNVVWTSANSEIVKVEADGTLTAVAEGEVEITGVLTDEVTGQTHEVSFHVTTMNGADDLYGHILSDLASGGGQFWSRLYPVDPANPDVLAFTDYVIYAEEYYDGKLYAYGYDPYIWEGSTWRLFVMDPVTQVIDYYLEMPANFPFVYDMTYDYATSTMYAVAGAGSDASDLYIVDLETGNLIPLLETEQFFMSLAAGPDGLLYAMAPSEEIVNEDDWWDPWAPSTPEITNATLYTIDPVTCEVTLVGDTGVKSNMLSSMSYDYDTGYLYWTPLYQGSSYVSGLCVVDTETAQATNLGVVGPAGAQISGLYIISENFPQETDEELLNLIVTPDATTVLVGKSANISAFCVPSTLNGNVDVKWTTADPAVAIVNNGIITGVSQGKTTVTATVTYNGKTLTDTCEISVLNADASFLTYNVTDGGWAAINRGDITNVTNLTEGVEETPVAAIVNVDGKVYGYDADLKFFELNLNDFTRNYLGEADPVYDEENYLTHFQIRDMAYDAANDRVLLLGALGYVDEYGWNEMTTGSRIYEVDLTTGKITELFTFYDLYYVRSLAADLEGNVYIYCTFNDFVYHIDLETGAQTMVVSTQSQSMYGDGNCDQSLFYDALTDTLYLLQTGNGNFYRMASIDPSSGLLVNMEFVGEVIDYSGDYYAGLTFVESIRVGEPEIPDETDVDFVSVSASMNGTIGLNFYVVLSDEVLADDTAYMQLSIGSETVAIPVSEAKISVKNGVTRHRFTIELAAAEMADTVVAQMYNAEGVLGRSLAYSVQKYADTIIAATSDEATANLMKTMLNYGAAAQVHFNHNVENLANANLAAEDAVLPESVDVSAYATKLTGAAEGMTLKSISLLLQSETTLRVYFTLDEGKTLADYTFAVDGKAVTPVADGDRYFVEVAGIAAAELDENHVFNLGGFQLTCSALTYVHNIQNNAELFSEAVVNMVIALYEYNQAANAYFGK